MIDSTLVSAGPPTLPYRVVDVAYLGGLTRPTKVYSNGCGGPCLTPDEIAVWNYVKWLEAEVQRLKELASPGSAPAAAVETMEAASMDTDPHAEPIPNTAPGDSNTGASGMSNSPTEQPLEMPTDIPNDAPGDKRARAEKELIANASDSNGVIAERIGASDELVRKVRLYLIAAGRIQPVASVIRKDGSSYTVGTKDEPEKLPIGDIAAAAPKE